MEIATEPFFVCQFHALSSQYCCGFISMSRSFTHHSLSTVHMHRWQFFSFNCLCVFVCGINDLQCWYFNSKCNPNFPRQILYSIDRSCSLHLTKLQHIRISTEGAEGISFSRVFKQFITKFNKICLFHIFNCHFDSVIYGRISMLIKR